MMTGDLDLGSSGYSPAADPRGTTTAGTDPDNWYPADHHRCVLYCRSQHPASSRRRYCQGCGGKFVIRQLDSEDIDPEMTRAERFAAWTGGWAAAFLDGVSLLRMRGQVPGECAECARRELIDKAAEADNERT